MKSHKRSQAMTVWQISVMLGHLLGIDGLWTTLIGISTRNI